MRTAPEIIFFKNKNRLRYKGKIEIEDLRSFVARMAKPESLLIQDREEIQTFVESKRAVLLFMKNRNDMILENFDFAMKSYPFPIAHALDESIIQNYGKFRKNFAIFFFQNFGKRHKMIEFDIFQNSQVKSFIERSQFDAVEYLDEEVYEAIFQQNRSAFLLFANRKKHQLEIEYFKKVGKKYMTDPKKSTLIFAIVDYKTYFGEIVSERLGLRSFSKTNFIFVGFPNGRLSQYLCAENDSLDAVMNCIDRFKRGSLPVQHKSEEVPQKQR